MFKIFFKKSSSHQWIQRQINDTFVKRASEENYRNRAAFKLIHLDDKFSFLRSKKTILDLGCYSGGWSQVALQRCPSGQVIGVDRLKLEPLPDPHIFIQSDIFKIEETVSRIYEVTKSVDVVLSDMSPSTIGVNLDDHLAMTDLNLKTCELMEQVLALKGWFILKTFSGPETEKLKIFLKSRFETVVGHKPESSRKSSAEIFLVCAKYRGRERIGKETASSYRYSKIEGTEKEPNGGYSPRDPQSLDGQKSQDSIFEAREKNKRK